jgi:hypothetical protein
MRFKLLTAVAAVAIRLPASLATAQVPQFSPFSADMQMTSTQGPQGSPREMDGKIFVGEGHMRLNVSAQGHETAVITDFATKTVDILMIEPKMYIEHKVGAMSRRGLSSPTEDLKPFDPNNPCANQPDITCKKIGVETVSGRNCEHWEITDKNGKVFNVWVDEKLHFPIKMISPEATTLLTNVNEGQPDVSLFKIPADFHRLDMSGTATPGAAGPPQN